MNSAARTPSAPRLLVACVVLLFAAGAFAASCPYCGRRYPDPAPWPGEKARVAALRRAHERSCPARTRKAPRRTTRTTTRRSRSGSSRARAGNDAFGAMLRGVLGAGLPGMPSRTNPQRVARDAFGAMVRGLMTEMAAQTARQSAEAAKAQQRRRVELERQRLERQRLARLRQQRLQLERIRQAKWLRDDWDRREEQMAERLQGVFDPVLPRQGTPFFGTGGAPEPDVFVDASVVDLRPEPDGRDLAEEELPAGPYSYEAAGGETGVLGGSIDPDFLRAQQIRAAETDAYATENYGSMWPGAERGDAAAPSIMGRVRKIGGMMGEDALNAAIGKLGINRASEAKRIYDAETGYVKNLRAVVSPETTWTLAHHPERADRIGVRIDKANESLLRSVTDDKSVRPKAYGDEFRALGRDVKRKFRGLLTGGTD